MVSMLGYETVYLTPSEDMAVVLKEDSAMLEGAVSTGMMVKTRVTAASMVTEIQGTVLGNSGTVLEMLGKVPGMMANGDELEVHVFSLIVQKYKGTSEVCRLLKIRCIH